MVSENEFPKYPSIRRIGTSEAEGVLEGEKVRVVEKMDGSNLRFMYKDGGIIFGSRDKVLNPNNPIKPDDEYSMGAHFEDGVRFILENIEWNEINWNRYKDYVLFGECMVSQKVKSHTIEYNWEDIPSFLGFDIYDKREGHFIRPSKMRNIYSDVLNLPTVPHIDTFNTENFEPSEYEIPDSRYRFGDPEGIIMVNTEKYPNSRPVKAKRWTEEFAETHKTASAKNTADSDTEEFIATYITEQRIKKRINKMIREGEWEEINKRMMEDLPMDVIEDAWEEEYKDVLRSDLEINMGELRHKTCRKCISVIEDMIDS